MVCGLKQCSGDNISRKQRGTRLIFQLATHIRASIIWFSCRSTPLSTLYFARALSVRAYTYSFLYGVAQIIIATEECLSPKRLACSKHLTLLQAFVL